MNKDNCAAFCIASGMFSGLSPRAPGTVGSLAAIPLWLALYYCGAWTNWPIRIFAVITLVGLGIWASSVVMKNSPDVEDPQYIVVDEWAGMWISFLALSEPSTLGVLLVLGWFRFFDITKLGPIGWAEKLPGAYGVMADDCVAGILAIPMVLLCQMGIGSI
ncbi:MAG: phosphatidylglycerophosphatase A [Deltaproteobacteria bacterium]|nr:phosphatidylglycerophosphatase A [Deltaproteobacteria bacterium]